MNRQEAIEYIRTNPQHYLKRAKKKGFICPICNNGTGADGDGITAKDNIHFSCFKAGCFMNSDIIDIIGIENGIADFNDRLKRASEIYNITIENDIEYRKDTQHTINTTTTESIKTYDHTAYIERCKANLKESPQALEYLHNRGLTDETIQRFNLGYDPQYSFYDSKKGQNVTIKGIVCPSDKNNSYYVIRDIEGEYQRKPGEKEAGKQPLYNLQALYNTEKAPVFIVEGQFCTMSIEQAGGHSISLQGAANRGKLIEALKGMKKDSIPPIILSLDNDEAGEIARDKLQRELKELNIEYMTVNIAGKYKDPNDHLKADKEAFYNAVNEVIRKSNKPNNISDYLEKTFSDEIIKLKAYPDIATGFTNLDKKTDSLYPGLYVIGAITSLGKTTFIHQMADQIAGNGQEVLFYSLEQSTFELASKSIARITAQNDIGTASSALRIRKGKWVEQDETKKQAIYKAFKDYRNKVGDRLSIIQGDFNCNITKIKEDVKRHIQRTKTKPIVIIDYLQAMLMGSDSNSTRGEIDSTVIELKRLSRDNDIVVIVISSFNRSNYMTPVDFESFKESGGIEYTADVVWGLQLQAINQANEQETGSRGGVSEKSIAKKREIIRVAKAESPRKIEFICLKNRYGISSYKCGFRYYPEFDLFMVDDTYSENTQKREQI